MVPIHLKAKVGPDGVLRAGIPLGIAYANREVEVIISQIQHPLDEGGTLESIASPGGSAADPASRHDGF